MTPEETASLPSVKHPSAESLVETVNRVRRLMNTMRAMRAIRWWNEWPPGHAEAKQPPRHVMEFQIEFGPLPESAERILETHKKAVNEPQ